MPRPTFTETGKQISEAEIAAAEETLNVTFPEQYRQFLLQTNGGKPYPHAVRNMPVDVFCGINQAGVSDLVYYSSLRREMGLPDDLLAIGYGVFGDTICLGAYGPRRGKVFIYDEEFNELTLYAHDFNTFLDSFYEPDLSDLNGDEGDEKDDDEDDDSPGT